MLKLILIATILIGLAFAGIAIKMFFFKEAEFHKSCSSIDSQSGKRLGCSCEGDENSSCGNG